MTAVIQAEKRQELGSSSAKKIKKAGKIPAIIYNAKENINVTLDGKEFEFEYFKGNIVSSVIELEIDGKKTKVIAHKVDVDPVTDRPVHVDFFGCDKAKEIKAQPKLNFINKDKSVGIKRGGFLNVSQRRVSVLCSIDNVPASIDVDVAAMQVGDKVRGSDLSLPAGVKLAKNGSFLIAGIIGRGGGANKDEEENKAEGAEASEETKEEAK